MPTKRKKRHDNQLRNRTYLMSPLSSVPSPCVSSFPPGRLDGCGRGRLAPAAGREPPALPTITTSLPLLPLLVLTSKPPGFNLLLTSPALLLKHPQNETLERGLSALQLLVGCENEDAAGARKGLAARTAMARSAPRSSSSQSN